MKAAIVLAHPAVQEVVVDAVLASDERDRCTRSTALGHHLRFEFCAIAATGARRGIRRGA